MSAGRLALLAGAAALAVAAIVLFLQLRTGPASAGDVELPEPAATTPKHETASEPPRRPTPPQPADINRPRAPIPTHKPAIPIKPKRTAAVEGSDRWKASEALRMASHAYANKSFREALEGVEKALEIDENLPLARSLAVLSACGLGRADRAAEHAKRLDERRRRPVIMRCHEEYGIELPF